MLGKPIEEIVMNKKVYINQEKEQRYINLANEFINTNIKDKYYLVSYNELGDDGEGFLMSHGSVYVFTNLTDEQLAEAKQVQAVCKEEEIGLWEYYEEYNNLPDYFNRDPYEGMLYEVNEGNFDDVYYKVNVTMAVFSDGIAAAPVLRDSCVMLGKDELVELLVWQMSNRNSNFNDLFATKPELFSYINDSLRFALREVYFLHVMPNATPIFAVELIGLQNYVAEILGEKSVSCQLWSTYEEKHMECIYLDIHERILSVYFTGLIDGVNHIESLDNVDASSVERALGVESYSGIVEWAKEHCSDACGVENFRQMLDDNGLEYTYDTKDYDL